MWEICPLPSLQSVSSLSSSLVSSGDSGNSSGMLTSRVCTIGKTGKVKFRQELVESTVIYHGKPVRSKNFAIGTQKVQFKNPIWSTIVKSDIIFKKFRRALTINQIHAETCKWDEIGWKCSMVNGYKIQWPMQSASTKYSRVRATLTAFLSFVTCKPDMKHVWYFSSFVHKRLSCASNKRQVRLKGENLRMRAICRNNMADENDELVSQALNYILSSYIVVNVVISVLLESQFVDINKLMLEDADKSQWFLKQNNS